MMLTCRNGTGGDWGSSSRIRLELKIASMTYWQEATSWQMGPQAGAT